MNRLEQINYINTESCVLLSFHFNKLISIRYMCKFHAIVTMFHKCSDTGWYNHHYYCHLIYLAYYWIYSELDSLDKIIISTHHC